MTLRTNPTEPPEEFPAKVPMPSSPDIALNARIEASFGTATPVIRRFALLAAMVMIIALFANTAKMVMDINAPGFDGQAVRIDFTAFWAAAKLAIAGDALSAFNPDVLRAAQQLPSTQPPGDLLWLYPPTWHIVIMPLGLLSFTAAYIVYSLIALAVFAAAMRPLVTPLPGGLILVLAAPAVLIILLLGNTSLLWTAGLLAALTTMTRGRLVLAGVLIALLTLKPQLGLLVPVALVFGGQWRTILWATYATTAIVIFATAIMGFAYWEQFVATMRAMSWLMQSDIVSFERMMTWYSLIRFNGGGHDLAMPVQLVVSLLAAASVGWVWIRNSVSDDIKAATLCIAIPLATPYAYHYEMVLSLAAAVFLARDGFGASRGARLWLLALWLGPVPTLALQGYVPPAIYAPPLVTATLILCLIRASNPPVQTGAVIDAAP